MQYTNRKFGIEIEFVGARRDEVASRLRAAGIDAQVEGYNHREISEQLAIAEGTSRWHFSQARQALRELLTSNWMRHGL